MSYKGLVTLVIPWLVACQNPGLAIIETQQLASKEESPQENSVWLRESLHRQTQTPAGVILCGEIATHVPDAFYWNANGVITLLGIGEAARLPVVLGVVLPDHSVEAPLGTRDNVFRSVELQGESRLVAEPREGSKKITYIRSTLESVQKALTERDECLKGVQLAPELPLFFASPFEIENRLLWDRSQLKLAGWNQDETSESQFRQLIFYGALLTGSSVAISYLHMDPHAQRTGAEMFQIPEVVPMGRDSKGLPGPWTPKPSFLARMKPKAVVGGVVGGALYGFGAAFDSYIWWEGERLGERVAAVKDELNQIMSLDEEDFRAHAKDNSRAHELITLALDQVAFEKMRQGL